jgi:peptidoglycan hydrolase-like protein with peptidoglycan-binding domain
MANGCIFIVFIIAIIEAMAAAMPAPFTRELKVTSPYQTGNDVTIAQTLLLRDSAVDKSLTVDGVYGPASATATSSFQKAHGMSATGVLDSPTADLLMQLHSADNYKDSGFTAASMGYLYKFHIPVHSNRSVETYATLYDSQNKELHRFRVRAHGLRSDGTSTGWPDFGNGDVGYTEWGSSGNTVTGLVEIDFNSPEPNPQVYGPWPVNRIVRGLDGNAKTCKLLHHILDIFWFISSTYLIYIVLPNIRDGILIHTGNWTTSTVDWNETMDMPNSSGCLHAHPSDIERIASILTSMGVVANPNPFSGKNYPYRVQGVGVIERID